jgi:hypothetical protein
MEWLAAAADAAPGDAGLDLVGAALTAAREGLDDAGWAEFQASLDAVGGVAALGDGGDVEAAVAARWAALGVARSAAGALSQSALRSGALAAAGLGTDLAGRKAESAAALMGRARLSGEAAARLVTQAAAGDASHRILALLLDEPDRDARLGLLPDAFDSGGADTASAASPSDQVDQVWTTPVKLVAAIDLALARLAEAAGGGGARASLPGACAAAPGGDEELVAVLQELREAALEFFGGE